MKTNFKVKDSFQLTDIEIDELAIFSGTYSKDADDKTRQEWRTQYRKVETNSNNSIAKYGSVEKWYESGDGRLL
jgi:hypothetical protein